MSYIPKYIRAKDVLKGDVCVYRPSIALSGVGGWTSIDADEECLSVICFYVIDDLEELEVDDRSMVKIPVECVYTHKIKHLNNCLRFASNFPVLLLSREETA
jgi:hypothetical protein